MRRALCLFLAACGSSTPSTGVILIAPEDGGAPRYGESPWPSDANRELAGLERIVPLMSARVAEHVAALGGFGLRPTVEFFLDGDLDPATLDEGGFLVDVDPASAERGRVVPLDWRWDPARRVAAGATPAGTVLAEGTRYAAVLTREVKDAGGRGLRPAPELPEGERWTTTRAARDELATRWDLAGLTVFTTQRAVGPLVAARALLDDPAVVAAPELAVPDAALVFTGAELDALFGVAERDAGGVERLGWANPTGVAHEHVGAVATGTITIARFRRDDSGDESPSDETFAIDGDGVPALVAIEPIPITFILPAGSPPPDGWPVAIIGHGLGASRHAMLTFAEPLTRAGFALVAIDFEGFGSRREPADDQNNTAGIVAEFSGDPALRDGFGDTTGMTTALAFLEGFQNFSATRDSVRQSVLDLGRVVQLVRADPDLLPLAPHLPVAPRLDVRRLAYLGESYGSHVGAVFAAVEPEVGFYVLDVPGGGLIDLEIVASPVIASLAVPFATAVYGFEGRLDRWHPAVTLIQGILDAADPLTYAGRVLDGTMGERHVLFIEVMGDELVPNDATDALSRAMGLHLLAPFSETVEGLPAAASPVSANVNGRTAVVAQYFPATHGANWTSEEGELQFVPGFPHEGDDPFPRLDQPVPIVNPVNETFDQVVQALVSYQGGPPIVVSTHTPEPPP